MVVDQFDANEHKRSHVTLKLSHMDEVAIAHIVAFLSKLRAYAPTQDADCPYRRFYTFRTLHVAATITATSPTFHRLQALLAIASCNSASFVFTTVLLVVAPKNVQCSHSSNEHAYGRKRAQNGEKGQVLAENLHGMR